MALGKALGQLLGAGAVVALRGDLGSGKTRLIQGIAEGLGVPPRERVCSPSFALIHEYRGRCPVYHMDFYRMETGSWEPDLGIEDYLWGDGVCVIEWAERIESLLPPDHLQVHLKIMGSRRRGLVFLAHGGRHGEILEGLRERLRIGHLAVRECSMDFRG
jgi:tRNA threonylcarbamoyladenosine biosynthesis protein TsaE